MNSTGHVDTTAAARAVGTGLVLGLLGYLAALVAFGYVGLFAGGADPGDQLAAGLAAGYVIGIITTVLVTVAAVRARRRRPPLATGLLAGISLGITLLILLIMRIIPVMDAAPSGCDCNPLIDQIDGSSA